MWFDSSECRYAGREVERILYVRAATLNSILSETGWTKSVLRTRLNYSNPALRRRWSRPVSAPRRVVVVAGCAEALRCDSCTSCTPLRRGRRTTAWNRVSHRAILVLTTTLSWRQRRRPCWLLTQHEVGKTDHHDLRLVGIEQKVVLGEPAFDVTGAGLERWETSTNSRCPHG